MFFRRTKRGKLAMMIEVQSSLVRGSLVWLDPGAAPYIAYDQSVFVPRDPDAGNDRMVSDVMKAADQAIGEMIRFVAELRGRGGAGDMPRSIAEAHCILSSPWIMSQARTVTARSERPVKATERYIRSLIDGERGAPAPGEETVEEKIFDVALNGYSVARWRNREAREVSVSYASSTGGEAARQLRQACARAVPHDRIHIHSSLLLHYAGFRALRPAERDYLMLHAHSELTDAVVVEDGLCAFFGSFPIGIQTAVRDVAAAIGTNLGAAESALSLYVGGKLDAGHAEAIAAAVAKASSSWTDGLSALLARREGKAGLPPRTVIAAHEHESFFAAALRTAFPANEVAILSLDDIARAVRYDPRAEKLRSVGLYAAAIHSLEGQADLSPVLSSGK
ncbi:MAG: hypothetical protein KGI69_02640 [Patescibacteria group bacterium]|nr:hypothetical protein [Patescibacteria group bacterium]